MIYLLEVSACLIVFYAFYCFCLNQKQFHNWNRFYLLSTLGLSFLIPALNIPFYEVTVAPPMVSNATISTSTLQINHTPIDQSIELSSVLFMIYLLIALFFLLKLIFELNAILEIIKSSSTTRKLFYTEVLVGEKLPLSSFFRYLIIPNSDKLSAFEYQHELAHIKQYHSVDKLLIGICNAVLWFNPVVYLMRKSFNEVHEYLADEAVIKQSNKTAYLNFLYNTVTKQNEFSTLNPFYSLIKNRLTMINNETRSSRKIHLLAIPLCVILLTVFSFEEYLTAQDPYSSDIQENLKDETKADSQELIFQENSIPDLETILSLTIQSKQKKDCKCLGLSLLYAAAREDIKRVINPGSIFNKESKQLLDNSKPGDKFILDNIKLDCQGVTINTKQVLFSIENKESKLQGHTTVRDTISVFNEDTFEETFTVVTKQIPIDERENKTPENNPENKEKYLLHQDTITFFDENTYTETVKVVENYATKEGYEAYQEAVASERYIFIQNTAANVDMGGILYVEIDDYLKNTASDFINEKGTYIYNIYEKGKLIKTSEPFNLADIKP